MLPAESASPITIRRVVLDGDVVVLEGHGVAERAACPACGATSDRVRDRYERAPLDLLWRGRVVRLRLAVRRFRCGNSTCQRETFSEDFGPTLPRYAPGAHRARHRRVRWLCLRPPEQLTPDGRIVLDRVLAKDADLARGERLATTLPSVLAAR